MNVPPLRTTQQAVTWWADWSAQLDRVRTQLDDLLPRPNGVDLPFGPITREAIEAALAEALLAADTVLGAFTRVLHQEQAAPTPAPYGHPGHHPGPPGY